MFSIDRTSGYPFTAQCIICVLEGALARLHLASGFREKIKEFRLCRPPFVFIDGTRTGDAAFYGFLVDLLPILFQIAGLGNYTLQYYISTNAGGEKLANGTWTGKLLYCKQCAAQQFAMH